MMSAAQAGKKLLGAIKTGQEVLAQVQQAKNTAMKALSQFVTSKTGLDKADALIRGVLMPNCPVLPQ